jgi:hypothetical protein
VAGLGAAYTLTRAPGTHVTLYEARAVLGGHANTVDVRLPSGAALPVDTGFLVYNENTYPNLCGLFEVRAAGSASPAPGRWLARGCPRGILCASTHALAPLAPPRLPLPTSAAGAGRAHGAL